MARAKKPTTEYRWEAYGPDGVVFKRGPIRDDIAKVKKYVDELRTEIDALDVEVFPAPKRHLAPYWRGAQIRILTRAISPWTELSRIDA